MKANNIAYWTTTALVAFFIGSGGVAQMAQFQGNVHGVVPVLGYPMYFLRRLRLSHPRPSRPCRSYCGIVGAATPKPYHRRPLSSDNPQASINTRATNPWSLIAGGLAGASQHQGDAGRQNRFNDCCHTVMTAPMSRLLLWLSRVDCS
jgi:hypothetical protein